MNTKHTENSKYRHELAAVCTTVVVTLAGWGYLIATLGERLLHPTVI